MTNQSNYEINESLVIPMKKPLELEKQLLNPATLVSCFLGFQELGIIDKESKK